MILPIYEKKSYAINHATYYMAVIQDTGTLNRKKGYIRVWLDNPFTVGAIFTFKGDCVRYVIDEREKTSDEIFRVVRVDGKPVGTADLRKFLRGARVYRKGRHDYNRE